MRETPLFFIDYTFHLTENNDIQFDPELTADQLCVKEGEMFKVKLVNNKVTLSRENV
jgi:hypothetical protein